MSSNNSNEDDRRRAASSAAARGGEGTDGAPQFRSASLSSSADELAEQQPRFRSMAMMAQRPPSLASVGGFVGGGASMVPPPQLMAQHSKPSNIGSGSGSGRGISGGDIRRDFEAGKTGEEEENSSAIRNNNNSSESTTKEARPTNWFVRSDSLKQVPTYYPLEKSSRYVTGKTVEEIAKEISECCRLMSVQAEYEINEAVPGTAYLKTSEHVEIQLQLWQGGGRYPDCVIVEAQRRRGDAVTFHKYSRHLLEAAAGDFSPVAFVHHEEKELEYCQKAEEMMAQKKMEAAASPKVDNASADDAALGSERENALMALEIAATLLKKDRMDARQLGMESLCLLTDPTRAGVETALIASRVVLTGSTQDESQDDDQYEGDEMGIREAILALVQFGRLGDDGGFDQESDSDEDEADKAHPDEQRHNDRLHNLALAVLANALNVLESHGRRLCEAGSESPSSVADSFMKESEERMDKDLIKTLLGKLGQASARPHDATLSAKCLRSLCEASKDARKRAKDLKAKTIVQEALEVGSRTHVKLEKESQKVITTLSKIEDEQA